MLKQSASRANLDVLVVIDTSEEMKEVHAPVRWVGVWVRFWVRGFGDWGFGLLGVLVRLFGWGFWMFGV